MVVSNISDCRLNAVLAFATANGARDIDSTPPAIIKSASPLRIALAPVPTASIPEPHSRFSVIPGTSMGKPANKPLMRATLRLSSPA